MDAIQNDLKFKMELTKGACELFLAENDAKPLSILEQQIGLGFVLQKLGDCLKHGHESCTHHIRPQMIATSGIYEEVGGPLKGIMLVHSTPSGELLSILVPPPPGISSLDQINLDESYVIMPVDVEERARTTLRDLNEKCGITGIEIAQSILKQLRFNEHVEDFEKALSEIRHLHNALGGGNTIPQA